MEAGSSEGIWTETLNNGHQMTVDTNFNVIRVLNPITGNTVKYDFDDGIKISDVAQVKRAHSQEEE